MSFKVIAPGFLTTVQDQGRFGYQHLGITTGGPMDEHSFTWANDLLGNPAGTATLEITYGGLTLEALEDVCIAITGADLDAQLNQTSIETWRTYMVKRHDRLVFKQPIAGLRAYLAVKGGFTAPQTLDSCSTVLREKLGGFDGQGRKIEAGDLLPFAAGQAYLNAHVPKKEIPDYNKALEVGLIESYQFDLFPRSERIKIYTESYEVTQNIDRMGYRLSGKPIKCSQDGIVSEGISCGAMQIPKDGQPIILLKDRQTIGGYPKMGSLTSLGIGQLAQRGPGAKIRFFPMDIEEAQAERFIFNQRRAIIRPSLTRATKPWG